MPKILQPAKYCIPGVICDDQWALWHCYDFCSLISCAGLVSKVQIFNNFKIKAALLPQHVVLQHRNSLTPSDDSSKPKALPFSPSPSLNPSKNSGNQPHSRWRLQDSGFKNNRCASLKRLEKSYLLSHIHACVHRGKSKWLIFLHLSYMECEKFSTIVHIIYKQGMKGKMRIMREVKEHVSKRNVVVWGQQTTHFF